jgi:hypothetical protein
MKNEKTLYYAFRVHVDDGGVAGEGVELGVYTEHAEAYAALIADQAKVPDNELFWTRPNWTAVSKKAALAWCIYPIAVTAEGKRVLVTEEYGPLEYEMDA